MQTKSHEAQIRRTKLRYKAQHGLANGVHVQPESSLLLN